MKGGRPRSSTRGFVEEYAGLDVRQLTLPPPHEPQLVSLTLKWADGPKVQQTIAPATTRTGIDALRHWLVCPGCGRRAGRLYAASSDRRL